MKSCWNSYINGILHVSQTQVVEKRCLIQEHQSTCKQVKLCSTHFSAKYKPQPLILKFVMCN